MFSSSPTERRAVQILFQSVGRLLRANVVVEGFFLGYEAAMWETVKLVFQGASIHGCAFHWSQAVWRGMQALIT